MGSCDFISSSDGAKKCLIGITFPADKKRILKLIGDSEGPEAAIVAANQLPEKMYQNMDEVIDCLNIKE